MVDFANANLCGASPELNDVLSKLADAKAEIINKLDEVASEAVAVFDEAQNELNSLTDKLQSIEIPVLPKLNLQSELKGVASLAPGSPAAIQSLAKIKSEFGSDLIAKGLGLGSLVQDATSAILGGGDVCALVGNLEKTAGSTEPAVEKAPKVLQAAEAAVSEAVSVAWQNPDVEEKVKAVAAKVAAHAVTSTLPTEDTGAYKIITSTKKISTSSGVVNAAETGTGKNVVAKGGILNKRTTTSEKLTASMITNLGRDGTFKLNNWKATLLHEPMGKIIIEMYPGPESIKKWSWFLNTDLDKHPVHGRFYRSPGGLHRFMFINTAGTGSTGSASVKINGNEINFESPFDWGPIDHPGDIDSGGNAGRFPSGKAWPSIGGDDTFHVWGRYQDTVTTDDSSSVFSDYFSDTAANKWCKGVAVWIQYEFLDNYDADPTPG